MNKISKGKNIGYIRVSTVDQHTERQLANIKLDKIFEEKISGRTVNRPQLQACLDYLREDDILYVHSIDRLARNLRDLLSIINNVLNKKASIRFVKERLSFEGNIDNNPHQNLQLQVIGAAAEFEYAMIHERQAEGIKLAQARGAYKNCGRRPSLSSAQIEEVRKRHSEGDGVSFLARHYKVSRSTIYNVLNANSKTKPKQKEPVPPSNDSKTEEEIWIESLDKPVASVYPRRKRNKSIASVYRRRVSKQ